MDSIWLRPESAGVGRPAEHTRADVAAAAVTVADAEGFRSVTMRRVAAELGTGAASLYRYVRNRDELLEVIADRIYGELPLLRTGQGPRADMLAALMEGFRQLQDRPWFAELLMERPFSTGPSSARLMEHYLTVLDEVPGSAPAKMEAVGVMAGMVTQYSTFVLSRNVPELMAAQAAYLMHVAQTGTYPHVTAMFTVPPTGGFGQEPPEQSLERILGMIYDGMLGAPASGP